MENEKNKFDWMSLVLGILSLIVGYYSFLNPSASLLGLVIMAGSFGIIKGCIQFYMSNQLKKVGLKHGMEILTGIISIFFGIFLIANWQFSLIALPITFAIWFLCASIVRLCSLNKLKRVSKGLFWVSLIVNVLGLVAAIFLLTNPLSAVVTVAFLIGFYFTITGIELFIKAFSSF